MSRARRRRAARDRRLGNNGTHQRWRRRLVRFEQALYVQHPPVKNQFARDREKRLSVGHICYGRTTLTTEMARWSCWARGAAWLGGRGE